MCVYVYVPTTCPNRVRDKQADLHTDTTIIKSAEFYYGGMFAHLQQYLSRSPYLPSFRCVSSVWRSRAAMRPHSCPSVRSCEEIRFDLFLHLRAELLFYQLNRWKVSLLINCIDLLFRFTNVHANICAHSHRNTHAEMPSDA